MKRFLKYLVPAILILGLMVLAGCGGQKAATEGEKTDQSSQPAAEVKTYKVGTDAAYAPFESVDPSGKVVGFDMDVLNAIGKAEGFNVEFVNTAWDGIIPSLTTNKNDIVISAMTITPDRQKEVDFSDSYFESTNYIVVPENSTVKSIADLKGKTVSVQQGTTGDVALTEFLGKDYTGIKRFKGTPEAFLELKNGKVDAAAADSGVVVEYVKGNPDQKLKVVKDDKFPKENYGIAVKKGNKELLDKINSGLKKIKDSGEYQKIYDNWLAVK